MGVLSQNTRLGSSAVTGDEWFVKYHLMHDQNETSQIAQWTPSANQTSNAKFTFSFWIKGMRDLDWAPILYVEHSSGSGNRCVIGFNQGYLEYTQNSGGGSNQRRTVRKMKDPSGWYHCVISFDGSQASQTDRTRFWINGVQDAGNGSGSDNMAATDSDINKNGSLQQLFKEGYFQISDIHMVDGQSLTGSDFGKQVGDDWRPKEYTGTHGTNGYHLRFNDVSTNTTLGEDKSANSNNWTFQNYSPLGAPGITSSKIKYSGYDATSLDTKYPSGMAVTGQESNRPICASFSYVNGNHGMSNGAYYRTWSFWVRRISAPGYSVPLGRFQHGESSSMEITDADGFRFTDGVGEVDFECHTTKLTDWSKWYHIVCQYDNNGEDRQVKVWIDGVQQDKDDSPSGRDVVQGNHFTHNYHGKYRTNNNSNDFPKCAGWEGPYSRIIYANMSYHDGYKYSASNFGETVNGVWTAKDYQNNVSYGTYGWHVKGADESNGCFEDATSNSNVTWSGSMSSTFSWTYAKPWQCVIPFTMSGTDNIEKFDFSASGPGYKTWITDDKTSSSWNQVAYPIEPKTTDSNGNTVLWMYQHNGGAANNEFKNIDIDGDSAAHKFSIPSTEADNYTHDTPVDSPSKVGTDVGTGGTNSCNYPVWSTVDMYTADGNLEDGNTRLHCYQNQPAGAVLTHKLPNTGKWYFEIKQGGGIVAGLLNCDKHSVGPVSTTNGVTVLDSADFYGFRCDGGGTAVYVYGNGRTDMGTWNTNRDAVYMPQNMSGNSWYVQTCMAVDMDNKKMWMGQGIYDSTATASTGGPYGRCLGIQWAKSGGYGTNGNPVTGAYPLYSGFGDDMIVAAFVGNNNEVYINCGQRSFVNGQEFIPTGYKGLSEINWPTPAITDPKGHFDVKLWDGNATDDRAITGFSFAPDLTFIKARGHAYPFTIHDSLRGANKQFAANSNDNESTNTDEIKSFTSDGYTLGTNNRVNNSPRSYVSYNWNMGTSNTSISAGDSNNGSPHIASVVRANQTAGQGIITYTGNGSADQKIAHGLGAIPWFMIIKNRTDDSSDFEVYHEWMSSGATMHINSDALQSDSDEPWYNTPTDKVFQLKQYDSVNKNGSNYVAYAFAPVEGYSRFGGFIGNGNDNGPFINCGFKPRLILIKKKTNATDPKDWFLYDIDRQDSDSQMSNPLYLNATTAAPTQAAYYIDITSQGFKIRNSGNGVNGSTSDNYIFCAWADKPGGLGNAY